MRNLGLCYAFGIGVAANPLEAVAYFLKAEEAGDVAAIRELAACYMSDDGVRDTSIKARLLTEAAEADDAVAMCELAACYATGDGAPRDVKKARYWFRQAKLSGDERVKERAKAGLKSLKS